MKKFKVILDRKPMNSDHMAEFLKGPMANNNKNNTVSYVI